jgi:hypothetical protein
VTECAAFATPVADNNTFSICPSVFYNPIMALEHLCHKRWIFSNGVAGADASVGYFRAGFDSITKGLQYVRQNLELSRIDKDSVRLGPVLLR